MKYSIIFLAIVFTTCLRDIEVKPMKYTRDGEELSCHGLFKNDSLIKVICLYNSGDTLLVDNYFNDKRNGISVRYYPSGQIMEIGNYENSAKSGIWKYYYPTGLIKSFKYFRLVNGKSQLHYNKIYKENGKLDSLMYPLEYRTNSEEPYRVGVTYQLFIDLLYSQYDSVHVWGLRDIDPNIPGYDYTVSYIGHTLYYEFTPDKKGRHSIDGVIWEINADMIPSDQAWGGERPFRFTYEAIE